MSVNPFELEDEKDRLSKWMQGEMDRRGWNQSDLAKVMGGIHPTMIGRWLQGMQPSTINARKIADAFGVRTEFILELAGHLGQEAPISEERREIIAMVKAANLTTDRADSLRSLLRSWAMSDRGLEG